MAKDGDLVLITGATGYLGSLVVLQALRQGYRVRMAVRSEARAQRVLTAPFIKEMNFGDRLSWVIVPDMSANGAYDEAVRGVKYIIHTAAPIPSYGLDNAPDPSTYEEYFMKPMVAGVLGILQSASASSSVKRVVMTSSIVAIVPIKYFMGDVDDKVFAAESRIPVDQGPWPMEFHAYSAGKAAELAESEAFVKNEKPGFDLISVIPGWIFGHDELATEVKALKTGSNFLLLSLLLGEKSGFAYSEFAVFGEDCAQVHILALDPNIEGNQSFLAGGKFVWQESLDVIRREERYIKAVHDGLLSLEGNQPSLAIRFDPAKTEETLGFRFQPQEVIVKSIVDQYLELS